VRQERLHAFHFGEGEWSGDDPLHLSKGCGAAEGSSLVVGGKAEDGGDVGYGNIILASGNKTWSRNVGYLAVNVHSIFIMAI
jgi:hypothetical protein